jgi:cellulose synthase operon protein C
LKEFAESARQFQDQAASFPDGVLYGDALFMWGESHFKQGDYEPALAAFQQARQSPASSEQMQILTLLHAAQSASQLTRFPEAIELLDELENRFPSNAYLPEAWYERGWARQKLDDLDKAFQEYERAAGPRNALGARARFMMGEVRFAQKKYDEAIREFQRAMYLYGGQEAPSDVKVWQAKAAYEAARCAEVQIGSAASANQRGTAIENAKKFYTYVVSNHADDPLASEARKRLEVLRKL